MNRPPLTVIIPWANRPELGKTLAANGPLLLETGAELLIVNCGGDQDDVRRQIRSAGVEATLLHLPCSFNRSLALNVGIHSTRTAAVFCLDSDILLSADSIPPELPSLLAGSFYTLARRHETARPWKPMEGLFDADVEDFVTSMSFEIRWKDGRKTSAPASRRFSRDVSSSGVGQLIVSTEAMRKIRGYNSELKGWGFEDVDVVLRLQAMLQLQHVERGVATHLSHGDEARNFRGKTRSESERENVMIACGRYSRGNLLGTMEEDLAQYAAAVVEEHIGAVAAFA